jgi:hypothetical protein
VSLCLKIRRNLVHKLTFGGNDGSLGAQHDQAAVDRDHLSGDEAGSLAAQDHQCRPEVVDRISERTAQGNRLVKIVALRR